MQQLVTTLLTVDASNETVKEAVAKIHLLPFQSYIYENVSQALQELSRLGKIVLFSQGEEEFQYAKVAGLIDNHILTKADVFVFKNKTAAIAKLVDKFSGYKKYVFDDHKKYLHQFYELDNGIVTILIETQERATDTIDGVTFAPSLAAPTFAEAVQKVKEYTSEFIHE